MDRAALYSVLMPDAFAIEDGWRRLRFFSHFETLDLTHDTTSAVNRISHLLGRRGQERRGDRSTPKPSSSIRTNCDVGTDWLPTNLVIRLVLDLIELPQHTLQLSNGDRFRAGRSSLTMASL
jgi:hypothetical protein